jgi:hypothetical protein
MSDLTANQHYVWQHYLRAWRAPKKIWCKRIEKPEPFETAPRNVGAERFFYEFPELTREDLAYLETVISQSNDEGLRKLNRGWIESFQMSFAIRKRLSEVEIDSEVRTQLETALREVEKTMGESYHGATETRAIPILDALRQGDVSFYADEKASMTFIDYISHQYFRTANLRNRMLAIPNPLPHDIRRTWPVEAFIYATNLASSFVRQRREYRIVLLRNKSQVPFITGDQPVINLRGVDVAEVDLYYPLQPDLAMIFTADRTRYTGDDANLGRIAVESYNHRIYAKSDSQIYGNDPVYLASLARLPKDDWF